LEPEPESIDPVLLVLLLNVLFDDVDFLPGGRSDIARIEEESEVKLASEDKEG
jgi:hypothetical protein